MTKEELKKGEIYRYDKVHISEYGSVGSMQIINQDLCWSENKWAWVMPISEATEEEKKYFRACKRVRRNLKISEVFELLGEAARPDEIPQTEVEYVELLNDTAWNVNKGIICKIVRQNEACSGQWVLNTNCVTPNRCQGYAEGEFLAVKSSCKPSTREAYEAQQKKELPEFWFIKNDRQEIRNWFAEKYNCEVIKTWTDYEYIGYDGSSYHNGVHGTSIDGFLANNKEISFDVFQKNFLQVNKCSTINQKQNGNEKSSEVNDLMDSNTGGTGGQEIRLRTPSIRTICESGFAESGREITQTRRSSKRPKAEIGERFI